MKRLSILAALVVFTGCGVNSEIKNGLPTRDTVKLNIPGAAGQALNAQTQQQGLQGQTAVFYQFTIAVTGMINGGTVGVLDLVRNVTDNPATSETANGAVWGPYTDPLSPNTLKLTATKTGAATFTYELDGKPKTAADSSYVALLTGTHTASTDAAGKPIQGFGSGSFTINWDNSHTLPQNDGNVGTAQVTYSRTDATAQASIQVAFTNVMDKDSGKLISANYSYVATPGQGGKFQFSENKDMVTTTAALEHLDVESRWLETGAGRADVKLTGGDVPNPPGQATANECWDSNFASQFLSASWDSTLGYGVEASACAFTPAEYSTL